MTSAPAMRSPLILRGRGGMAGHPSFDRIDADHPLGFEATVQRAQLSTLDVQVTDLTPCTVQRTAHTGRAAMEVLVAVADTPSTVRVTGLGREIACGAGQLVLVMADQPVTWTFPAPARLTTVAVPVVVLAELGVRLVTHRVMAVAESALGRATAEFVQQFARDAVDCPQRIKTGAERTVIGLICGAVEVGELDTGSSEVAEAARIRTRVIEMIDRDFAQASLTVDAIAASLAMSRRHLYRYFESDSETVAELIAARRLEHVCTLLRRPGQATMEEISASSGFTCTGTMRRRFLARYGMTPRDYQRQWQSAVDIAARVEKPSTYALADRPSRPVAGLHEAS